MWRRVLREVFGARRHGYVFVCLCRESYINVALPDRLGPAAGSAGRNCLQLPGFRDRVLCRAGFTPDIDNPIRAWPA